VYSCTPVNIKVHVSSLMIYFALQYTLQYFDFTLVKKVMLRAKLVHLLASYVLMS